jgi:hypothetical protein
LAAHRQILARPFDHRSSIRRAHRPGLLPKKSLSTVSWPILMVWTASPQRHLSAKAWSQERHKEGDRP